MGFKDTIPKANQIKIIVTFILVAICITLIVVFRDQLFKVNENITDAQRFYKEYNKTGLDNVFKYVTASEALELLKDGSSVVYFGFKDCKWCQSYAPILNEVAKENGFDTIYYCDIKKDRKDNTESYQGLVEILKDHLYDDDDGNKRIYVPDVYFINKGEIVGHNNDTSTEEGTDVEEYYSMHKEDLKNKLTELFKKVEIETCDDSGKGC